MYGAGWTGLNGGGGGGFGGGGGDVDEDVDDEAAMAAATATEETAATAVGVGAGGVVGQGPTVAFNVKRPDGGYVGYTAVERIASAAGVHLRTGCCCNPGGCNAAVRTAGLRVGGRGRARALYDAGKVCGDSMDVDDEGTPAGVVRVSFGYSSTLEDADRLVGVIREHFVVVAAAAAAVDENTIITDAVKKQFTQTPTRRGTRQIRRRQTELFCSGGAESESGSPPRDSARG